MIIGGVIIAILVIVQLILGLIGGWQGYGYRMMGGFGGGWFMPLFMVIFWGLVIWGVVALVRGVASSRSSGTSNQTDSALEILKRRYARGEITKQEYEEKKKDLI